MRRILSISWMLLAGLTGSATAHEEGLQHLFVTFETPPEAALEILATRPGVQSALWDSTANAFRVELEDSLHFVPREFLEDLEARGMAVSDLILHFETARSLMRDHFGWVTSGANRMELVARNSTYNRRMWNFVGRNPRGLQVEMEMDCRVFPAGAPDSTGVFPPDSVDVIRFRVAKKLLEEGN